MGLLVPHVQRCSQLCLSASAVFPGRVRCLAEQCWAAVHRSGVGSRPGLSAGLLFWSLRALNRVVRICSLPGHQCCVRWTLPLGATGRFSARGWYTSQHQHGWVDFPMPALNFVQSRVVWAPCLLAFRKQWGGHCGGTHSWCYRPGLFDTYTRQGHRLSVRALMPMLSMGVRMGGS